MVFDLLHTFLGWDLGSLSRSGRVLNDSPKTGGLETLLFKDDKIRWVKHQETIIVGIVWLRIRKYLARTKTFLKLPVSVCVCVYTYVSPFFRTSFTVQRMVSYIDLHLRPTKITIPLLTESKRRSLRDIDRE